MSSSRQRGKGRGAARGRNEDPEVQLSKTLSYILRHGAQREGLSMRSDGYVKLEDLLKRPKLRGTTLSDVINVVETNEKRRFTLLWDPSQDLATEIQEGSSIAAESEPRATQVIIPSPSGVESMPQLRELDSLDGTWWIRANQGHSVKVDDLELRLVEDAAEIPVAIHGTNGRAWESIARKGLSKMGRNHIHIAAGKPGASGILSGMRTGSEVMIYIDVAKAMESGLKFYLSANGVILTEGDSEGFVLREFFQKVERKGVELPDTWRTL